LGYRWHKIFFQGFEIAHKKNAKFNEKSFINMAMNLIKRTKHKKLYIKKNKEERKWEKRLGKNEGMEKHTAWENKPKNVIKIRK